MIDPTVAAILVSREKSIKKLDEDLARLDAVISQVRNPIGQKSLFAQREVKAQRRARLVAELEGLRATQLELDVGAKAPAKAR